jgi:disulfide oxidoreductase YuzD
LAEGLKITVLGGEGQNKCDAGCGEDWSAPESRVFAAERIKERFGEEIPLEYLDIDASPDSRTVKEWRGQIREGNVVLPLLLLNGQLRISGQFDIRQLLDAIEIEKEVGDF